MKRGDYPAVSRFRYSCLGTLVIILQAGTAWAEHRLHERVDSPGQDEGPLIEQPAEGRNPSALRVGYRELPEPRHAEDLRPEELPFEPRSGGNDSLGRLGRYRPDLETGAFPDQLRYRSVFSPSVAPYKRQSVLDTVGPDYSLSLSSRALEQVPVGGRPEVDRDLFWGSLVVRFRSNQPVPIPSVAPGARILSVSARPDRAIRFYRDGGHNYYVTSTEAGQTRIVFVTDGPSSYFGSALPEDVGAEAVPPAIRPSVPTNVAEAVGQVSARIGLDPRALLARNMTRLVTYLRSFQAEDLDHPAGADPYLTLAFGRRGVCRHRAFVFVVTMQGLGIPARYVTNEAHAFAEAYVPTVGWLRVDLGGEGPLVTDGEAPVHHQPRAPDPFPWPPTGPSPSASAQGGPPGPQGGQSAGRGGQQPTGGPTPPRRDDGTGRAPSGHEPGRAGDEGQAQSPGGDASPVPPGTGPESSPGQPQAQSPEEQPSPRLRAVIETAAEQVTRGGSLHVGGRIEGPDGPMPRVQVMVYLRPGGRSDLVRLGQTTTGSDGRFQVRLVVPQDLPPGDYAVIARPRD